MPDPLLAKLQKVIQEVVAKIRKYQDRALGEQNTKASLIEPVLEALGWDIRDPDEVQREFKPTTQDMPVDYSLNLLRKPRLFVEAKGLGETLSDRRWISQVLGYATVAGVEWCVLTDGNEYRFYNATVALDADEKLFFQIRLTDGHEVDGARILKLISRSDMAENLLEVLWSTHYVDRRVKCALQEMFANRDRGLIRLVRRKVSRLTPREIFESLRRLDVNVESPAIIRDLAGGARPRDRNEDGGRCAKAKKKTYAANLKDLIAARLLAPPTKLFRKYKGHMVEAMLLPDGSVEFAGKLYDSCSTAAERARESIMGRKMNTNGWEFWQFMDGDRKKRTLAEARDSLLEAKGASPSAGSGN